jgi:hypothetical protein
LLAATRRKFGLNQWYNILVDKRGRPATSYRDLADAAIVLLSSLR